MSKYDKMVALNAERSREKMEKAKKTLLYTAIGFGVLMLAVPLVNFFVSMFSNSTQDLGNVTQFN